MNGYRRGAYENMTKDMNNEERILTLCITLRVLIGSHKTSVFALDIMHLEISIRKISFQAKIVLVLLKGTISFDARRFNISNNDPNKAKGIIYMPEHLTHSQNGLTQLIKIFTMGWHQRRTLCSHFKNRQR